MRKMEKRTRPCEEVCLMGFIWGLVLSGAGSALFCEILPWALFLGVPGLLVTLMYCGTVALLCRAYVLTTTTTSHPPADWAPSDATEDELRAAKEQAVAR
jgi:hypothetical protein